MKRIIYFLSLFLFACFFSCEEKPDCFKGTGPLTTEERQAGHLREIDLFCNADVVVHFDTVNRIRVTAGANLVGKIQTHLENGILTIRNHNRCNWVRSFDPSIQVDVWTDDLFYIRTDDSNGDITFADTLHTYEFRFDSYSSLGTYHLLLDTYVSTLVLNNGPADFYGAGKSAVAYYYSAGYGKMDFRNIETEKIFMNNRGTNDMYVYAKELIEARIEYSGNIYYKGNPSIKKEITGSGQMLPLH